MDLNPIVLGQNQVWIGQEYIFIFQLSMFFSPELTSRISILLSLHIKKLSLWMEKAKENLFFFKIFRKQINKKEADESNLRIIMNRQGGEYFTLVGSSHQLFFFWEGHHFNYLAELSSTKMRNQSNLYRTLGPYTRDFLASSISIYVPSLALLPNSNMLV